MTTHYLMIDPIRSELECVITDTREAIQYILDDFERTPLIMETIMDGKCVSIETYHLLPNDLN